MIHRPLRMYRPAARRAVSGSVRMFPTLASCTASNAHNRFMHRHRSPSHTFGIVAAAWIGWTAVTMLARCGDSRVHVQQAAKQYPAAGHARAGVCAGAPRGSLGPRDKWLDSDATR